MPASILRKQLINYVEAEARGQDPEQLFPTLAAFVAADPHLQEELQELRELLLPVYLGKMDEAPTYPTPDLSFLEDEEPERTLSGVWEDTRRLVVQFTQSLLDSLRPSPLLRVRASPHGQRLYRYSHPTSKAEPIGLQIEMFSAEAERVTLTATVILTDRDPFAQGRSQVRLSWGVEQVEADTDEAGYVVFTGIPLSALPSLEVQVLAAPGSGEASG